MAKAKATKSAKSAATKSAKVAPAKSATKKAVKAKNTAAKSSTKKEAAPAKSSVNLTAALKLAKELKKSDGPCEAIRGVAKKFRTLERADVLEVAASAGINKFTASRQFHLQRAGAV